MTNINEQAILHLFSELPIGEVFETIFNEDSTEEETTQICGGLLIPAAIQMFAEKYHSFERTDDEDDLNPFWEMFCRQENIPSDLQNIISQSINEAAAEFEPTDDEDNEDYADDESDEDGVITNTAWDKLSNDERIARVKALLKNIAASGSDFGGAAYSLTKQSLGDKPDPYGNVWAKNKVFDRKANNFGWGPENQKTPEGNSYLQTESVSRKHFQATADIIRAIENAEKRQAYADHHAEIFKRLNPRFDGAKFHKAAGTKFQGKTTIKEGNALHNLPIKESLFNPASVSKVQKYADWLNANPNFFKPLDDSGAEDLKEAGRVRAESEKKFQNGSDDYDPSDFIFGRTRPGRRK